MVFILIRESLDKGYDGGVIMWWLKGFNLKYLYLNDVPEEVLKLGLACSILDISIIHYSLTYLSLIGETDLRSSGCLDGI